MLDVVSEVRKLDLPVGEYAVVGSGALVVRGLRETNDVDILVSQRMYDQLKAGGWKEGHKPDSTWSPFLSRDNVEVCTNWSVLNVYYPDAKQLIADADLIDGVAFARLKDVREWKEKCAREKDLHDVALINGYLQSTQPE